MKKRTARHFKNPRYYFILFCALKNNMNEKHQKVKNPQYRQILDERTINIITPSEFMKKWEQIPEFPIKMKQLKYYSFLLYWTGARPSELLMLQAKDFNYAYRAKHQILKLNLPTLKKGTPRTIQLKTSLIPHAKKIWEWATNYFPDFLIFNNLISEAIITHRFKDGRVKKYRQLSRKIHHWVSKYFGVPPYFFRHNRLSDMADKGATLQELKYFKGAKKLENVEVYIQLVGKKAEDLSKYLY